MWELRFLLDFAVILKLLLKKKLLIKKEDSLELFLRTTKAIISFFISIPGKYYSHRSLIATT